MSILGPATLFAIAGPPSFLAGYAGRELGPSVLAAQGKALLRLASSRPEDVLSASVECGIESLLLPPGMAESMSALMAAMPDSEARPSLQSPHPEETASAALMRFLDEDALGLPRAHRKPRPSIALVGPMAAGKTTVARLLASRLGLPFFDTDQVIESACGLSIPVIFKDEGEPCFREREAAALLAVLGLAPSVIATGGGVVLKESNRAALAAGCFVAWLHANPRILAERSKGGSRPLLADGDPVRRLESIYHARLPLYAGSADILVPAGARSPEEIAEVILDAYMRLG